MDREKMDFINRIIGKQVCLISRNCELVCIGFGEYMPDHHKPGEYKQEFVSKNVAHWDVFKDTANNSALWLGNKTQTAWHETGYFIEDLLKIFPK